MQKKKNVTALQHRILKTITNIYLDLNGCVRLWSERRQH